MTFQITIARTGGAWAVKHNNGFLGDARSREEATAIGRDLVDWMREQGRSIELVVEELRRAC